MTSFVTRYLPSIARIEQVYYTPAHGHGHPRRRAIAVVGRHRGLAEVAGASVLHPAECVARRLGLRSVRREEVPGLLRVRHGTAEPGAWPLLPVAAARLLRGDRLGARHRVARDGLVGHPKFSGAGPG